MQRRFAVIALSILASAGCGIALSFSPISRCMAFVAHRGEGRHQSFDVQVTNFRAVVDRDETTVIENPGNVRYRTPTFKVAATVQAKFPVGSKFTLGFIQQINQIHERFEYKRAYTGYEIPFAPICDYDDVEAPWMGSLARTGINGNGHSQLIELSASDSPDGFVGWREPLPPDGNKEATTAELQSVKRDEDFTTWLVLRDNDSGQCIVLKRVNWSCHVDISIDTTRPLGWRATVNHARREEPVVETPDASNGDSMKIPARVLKGPSGNAAEKLWWTPEIKGIGKRTALQ